jgi:hypothetical protein
MEKWVALMNNEQGLIAVKEENRSNKGLEDTALKFLHTQS